MVSKIVGHWGRLDVLVNNAGVLTQAPVMEVATSDWDRVMAVNARGTLLCTQAAGREMVTRHRGCIVNIASIAAREATPGLAAYASLKICRIGAYPSNGKGTRELRCTVQRSLSRLRRNSDA